MSDGTAFEIYVWYRLLEGVCERQLLLWEDEYAHFVIEAGSAKMLYDSVMKDILG